MDPIHLQNEELDYELSIRGFNELGHEHLRVKTGKLREALTHEAANINTAPSEGSSPYETETDLQQCNTICQQIQRIVCNDTVTYSDLEQARSRAIHVHDRLRRIQPESSKQQEELGLYSVTARELRAVIQEKISYTNPNARRPRPPPQLQQESVQPPPPPFERKLSRPTMYEETNPGQHSFVSANNRSRRSTNRVVTHTPAERSHSLPASTATATNTRNTATYAPNSELNVPPTDTDDAAPIPPPNANIIPGGRQPPALLNNRRSTAFWDEHQPGARTGLSHRAQEFIPSNRPSISEITVQPNQLHPQAAVNTGPFQPNTVRFEQEREPLLYISPGANLRPETDFGTNTQEELADILRTQANQGWPNNRRTASRPTNRPFDVYIDTPFREDVGHQRHLPSNQPAYNEPNANHYAMTAHTNASKRREFLDDAGEPEDEHQWALENLRLERPENIRRNQMRSARGNALMSLQHQNRYEHEDPANDEAPMPHAINYAYRNQDERREWCQQNVWHQHNNLHRTYYVDRPTRTDHRNELYPPHAPMQLNQPRVPPNGPPEPEEDPHPYQHLINRVRAPVNQPGALKPIAINSWKIYFSGEIELGKNEHGVNDFLILVEMLKKANRVSDEAMVHNIGLLLKRSALCWYIGNAHTIRTWSQFVHKFRTKYLSEDATFEILSEIENRTQNKNESAAVYIADMVNRFRSMPMPLSEEHQCHIIQRNLSKTNALKLAEKRYRKIIELEQACRNLESMRKHFRLNPFPEDRPIRGQGPRNNIHSLDQPDYDCEKQINSDSESDGGDLPVHALLQKTKPINKQPFDKRTTKPKQTVGATNRSVPSKRDEKPKAEDRPCYNCGAKGHWFQDCPSDRTRIFCFRCGANNTYAAECPKCNPTPTSKSDKPQAKPNPNNKMFAVETESDTGEAETPHISTLVENIPHDNRPYVRVKLAGKEMLGLLDSGACISLIGGESELYIDPKHRAKANRTRKVKTADGTSHEVEAIVNLPVTYNNMRRKIELLIVPGIPKSLILGTNFWKAFGLELTVANQLAVLSEEIKSPTTPPPTCHHELSQTQKIQLEEAKSHFRFTNHGELGYTPLIEHKIETGDANPVKQRPYHVSPYVQAKMNEEIDRMMSLGIIEKAKSPTWLSPIIPVKKANGNVRLCLDARNLNAATKKNAYPQQNANRILQRMTGTQYLSSIDLSDAYYQIKIHPDSRKLTAFSVSSKGTYQYVRMANGLCNASSTLCELIDNIMGCDLEPYVFPYMDDFVICTNTFEEHVKTIAEVGKRLTQAGLTVSAEKSHFCLTQIRYLGYLVTSKGVKPDPEKTRPIIEYPAPANVKGVRRLIGMTGYYRRFIPNFSALAAPITTLLRKEHAKFQWTEEANHAFGEVKQILTSQPILAPPDYNLPFTIHCDASEIGIGAVLMQKQGDEEKVVAYYSSKLTPAETRYSPTERECLAVIKSIENFRSYVEGVKFSIITDHASLIWLQKSKSTNGKLARWSLRLQAYDFEIIHRKGKLNVVPDALSRAPIDLIDHSDLNKSSDPLYLQLILDVQNQKTNPTKYRIENDVLLINTEPFGEQKWRTYVPTDFVNEVLSECHSEISSCHGGFWKTYLKMTYHYYWPTMKTDTEAFVKSCDVCKAAKPTNRNEKNVMGAYRNPLGPWRVLAIDFIGPLVRSKNGHKWILSIIDNFSKYVHIIPLREATAGLTIKAIEREIFLRFGIPQTIICDNGTQFKSKTFTDFTNQYKTQVQYTANYNPQANPCEAANKAIGTAIRCYLGEKQHNEWDTITSQIQCALNNQPHHSTGRTPYEIIFGQQMVIAGNRHDLPVDETDDLPSKMQVIRNEVALALKKAYEKASKQYNLRAREIEYKIGDVVWKKNTVLSNKEKKVMHKLLPRNDKCTVIAKVGHNMYQLADQNGKDIGVFPSSMLKA